MAERRFNDAEIAAILERATQTHPTGRRQLLAGDGMTLAELQAIGREVGIAPEAIRDAAVVVGQGGLATVRRFLGLPLGVGRTVELERRLTDEEWERFVVDLRETFDARGVVKGEGSLRQWTNGNLQALLEPTQTGHRVRLRTFRGNARGIMMIGLALVSFSAAILVGSIIAGIAGQPSVLAEMGEFALIGGVLVGAGALMVPRWAKLRRRQMEELAGRLLLAAGSDPEPDSGDAEPA